MATIILAEDDDGVRRMMRALLVHFGHIVIEAVDGVEAAMACESEVFIVDLVMIDMQMPRMDGRELVEAIKGHRPSPRVLICSGAERIEGLPHLTKPFTPQQLRFAVDAALAGPTLAELLTARPS